MPSLLSTFNTITMKRRCLQKLIIAQKVNTRAFVTVIMKYHPRLNAPEPGHASPEFC